MAAPVIGCSHDLLALCGGRFASIDHVLHTIAFLLGNKPFFIKDMVEIRKPHLLGEGLLFLTGIVAGHTVHLLLGYFCRGNGNYA